MTFREKMQKEHPDCIHKDYRGGVSGCPSDYFNYENEGGCVGFLDSSREKCTKCWDREIPTTLDAIKKEMTIDEAIKHCEDVANGKLCEGTVNHKACGAEHKQLAEWLQELKRMRAKFLKKIVEGLEMDEEPECPNCGEYLNLFVEDNYCHNCGQALSWDYVDEEDAQ